MAQGTDPMRRLEMNRARIRAIDVEMYQLRVEQGEIQGRKARRKHFREDYEGSAGALLWLVFGLIVLGVMTVILFMLNSFLSILFGVILSAIMLVMIWESIKVVIKAGVGKVDRRRKSAVDDIDSRIQALSEEKTRLQKDNNNLTGM